MSSVQSWHNCACGKSKGNMNTTNWQRHIDACKKKRKSVTPLDHFFKKRPAIKDTDNDRDDTSTACAGKPYDLNKFNTSSYHFVF